MIQKNENGPLIYRTEGATATILLNRPDKRNALNFHTFSEIPALIGRAEADPSVNHVVITGSTDQAFAAGADIAEFVQLNDTPEATARYQDAVLGAMAAVEACLKPVVAVIRGPCVGAGCGLALACDLRFADPTARLGITPAKLGLVYSLEDTRRLIQAVGLSRGRDLLYSGRLVTADEALTIGLVDFVHPAATLGQAVADYLAQLDANSQFTIRAVKRISGRIALGAHSDDDETRALFVAAFAAADYREGTAAFLGKRKARFPFR